MSKAYCIPANAGLASEPKAVARRLSRLLTALATEINDHVVTGQIADDVRQFRMALHDRLTNSCWRIKATDNGWRVLPPKGDR